MEIEKKVVLLQNTYAASIAETVNTYEKYGVLDSIVAKRKEKQALSAPYMNRQLAIRSIEDVFSRLSEIYGCAKWSVTKAEDGFAATASACKLCAMSKKDGWRISLCWMVS